MVSPRLAVSLMGQPRILLAGELQGRGRDSCLQEVAVDHMCSRKLVNLEANSHIATASGLQAIHMDLVSSSTLVGLCAQVAERGHLRSPMCKGLL